MTTLALTSATAPASDRSGQHAGPASPWPLAIVALLLGLAFFLTEHSLDISLVDAYTQTADEMELAAGGGNATRRVMFLGLAAMGAWLALSRRGQDCVVNWPLAIAVGGYLLVSFVSFLWADDPGMCLRRLAMLGCCVLAALGIARRFSMRELCLLAVGIIGSLVLLGLAAEIRLGTFRPWSGDYRFSGSIHPNTQNMYLTMLGLASLGLARIDGERFARGYWLVFLAAMGLSLLTKSRTGNASMLLAVASIYLLQTPLRFKVVSACIVGWLGLVAVWALCLCGINPLTDFQDTLLLGRTEQSDSLSGRAFIWPVVTHYIGQRPWLGYGYESFWNPGHIDSISDELQWGLREAHNGYLEVLLSTGIVGLVAASVAVLAGLVASASASVRLQDPAYGLPLGMLVFGVASSFMESGMVGVMLPPFVLACCLLKMALFADRIPRDVLFPRGAL